MKKRHSGDTLADLIFGVAVVGANKKTIPARPNSVRAKIMVAFLDLAVAVVWRI